MPALKWFRLLLAALLISLSSAACAAATPGWIRPGAVWRDTQGRQIQAHGGGILYLHHTWYWFGEDRTPGLDPSRRYVSLYSSRDLIHWAFLGCPLQISDPEHLGPHWILERPKVFYSPLTHRFVMYFHLDNAHYQLARVGVAVSSRVAGPYKYVSSFRPLGFESRDIGQFIDDDGSAYLIFESRPSGGFYIARLSPDRLSVEREISFLHIPLEGGALVHYQGLYSVLGSHLTGWRPNPNVYATAPSLSGPWTQFQEIAPASADTYGSQSSMLLKVKGTSSTAIIFMGDIWKPKTLWDSRYLWMPLKVGGGHLLLPPPAPWSIDVKTGEVSAGGDSGSER